VSAVAALQLRQAAGVRDVECDPHPLAAWTAAGNISM
jgi:hypothetical protein